MPFYIMLSKHLLLQQFKLIFSEIDLDDIVCEGPSQLGKALQLALSVFVPGKPISIVLALVLAFRVFYYIFCFGRVELL